MQKDEMIAISPSGRHFFKLSISRPHHEAYEKSLYASWKPGILVMLLCPCCILFSYTE